MTHSNFRTTSSRPHSAYPGRTIALGWLVCLGISACPVPQGPAPALAPLSAALLSSDPWEGTASQTLTFVAPRSGTDLSALVTPGNAQPTWLLGDFDGDGTTDLVNKQVAETAEGELWFASATGALTQRPMRARSDGDNTPFPGACQRCIWLVGDIDGDGRQDLVSPQRNGKVRVLYSEYKPEQQGGQFRAADYAGPLGEMDDNQLTWLLGDFDRDGRQDLASLSSHTASGTVLFSDREAGMVRYLFDESNGAEPHLAPREHPLYQWLAGDVDGDGRTDLVRRSHNGQGNRLFLANFRNHEGHFETDQNHTPDNRRGVAPSTEWWLADLDGDGDADLIKRSGKQLDIGFFTANSGHVFGDTPLNVPALANQASAPYLVSGDFDGDGRLDLLQTHRTGSWTHLWLSRYRNDGAQGVFVQVDNPTPVQIDAQVSRGLVRVADFNGDAHSDLLATTVARPLRTSPRLLLASYSEQQPLFTPGQTSTQGQTYYRFRIPGLTRAADGTLIALAEGRVDRAGSVSACDGQVHHLDSGNIDVVMRRSHDGGNTWSPLETVLDAGCETVGNPTPVVDQETGKIWLFVSENSGLVGSADEVRPGGRRLWLSSSDDSGRSWSKARHLSGWAEEAELGEQDFQNRTPEPDCVPSPQDEYCVPQDAKDWNPDGLLPYVHSDTQTGTSERWAWDAVGPGNGIQTRSGRLVIPARGRNLYSDDHGKHWETELVDPGCSDEGAIVERSDGRLMRNDRPSGRCMAPDRNQQSYRQVAIQNGEGSWETFSNDTRLPDSRCQGSMISLKRIGRYTILLTNATDVKRRAGSLKTRYSLDDGVTWSEGRNTCGVHQTDSMERNQIKVGGYTSMVARGPDDVAALVEAAAPDPVNKNELANGILFRRFNLTWLQEED